VRVAADQLRGDAPCDLLQAAGALLLQERKNDAMQKWLKDLDKEYESKITYAVGYAPPKTATTATTTG
jgi:hypothetical protein